MNPESFDLGDEPLAQSLRRFRPAATPIEPTELFYQMGFAAGQRASDQTQPRRRQRTLATMTIPLLAAALSAIMIGPVGYRLGQTSIDPRVPVSLALPSSGSSEGVSVQLENDEPNRPSMASAPAKSPSDAVDTIAQLQAPAPQARSKSTPVAPHTPAEAVLQPQSKVGMAVADWLIGNPRVHPRANPTQRLSLADAAEFGGDRVLLIDRRLATHLIAAAAPRPVSTSVRRPKTPPSPPAPLLRVGDWKEVIDPKDFN